MTRLRRLKLDALESCKYRGHDMKRFKTLKPGVALSECRRCKMYVMVNVKPLPNDIDIGGSAVALGCGDSV